MSVHFDYAYKWLLSVEGGYNNDPDDRGGETKYGISKRSYPDLDIAKLTKPQARSIYMRDYWLPARCDHMPRHFAWACFGAAVIHGPKRSIQFLQGALGVAADGIYGPITHKAAWAADDRWKPVLREVLANRALFMKAIADNDPTQQKWIRGWYIRLFSLQQMILEAL